MLGGRWSWEKPGESFCNNCFAHTSDAKYHWNISPGAGLDVWG